MAISYNTSIVRHGLVLHLDAANPKSYPGSGTTLKDLSGNGNNAALINGPTYSAANKGIFVFDGINDYIESAGGYHLNQKLTISMWFKPTNSISSGVNNVGRLWGMGADFEARFDGGAATAFGQLVADLGGTTSIQSTKNVWLNILWYNLCITIDSATGISKMYIQSKLDATGTCGVFTSQSNPIQIGKSASGGGSPFPGSISNFTIYNRILTAQEIKQNFEATRTRYGI